MIRASSVFGMASHDRQLRRDSQGPRLDKARTLIAPSVSSPYQVERRTNTISRTSLASFTSFLYPPPNKRIRRLYRLIRRKLPASLNSSLQHPFTNNHYVLSMRQKCNPPSTPHSTEGHRERICNSYPNSPYTQDTYQDVTVQ